MQININNLNINYIEKGPDTKTNILLLHGWGTSIASFESILGDLSSKFKVYAIDFPGFGLSEEPPKEYTVEDYSKIVLQFIIQKKLENVILVGHSFGGRVIIKLVGKLGYKPNKIILVDSAGIRPKKTFKSKVKEKIFRVLKVISRVLLGKKKSEKLIEKYRNKMGSADYKNADSTMKEVFKNVVNEDLTQYLPNINVPTLLIWGDCDTATPISDGKKMEELIPDAGLVTITGAGHYSFIDNTNYFLTVVNKFLEGCD